MLGRVSREGGGVRLKGALHPEQIMAVASSLIVDIDTVVRADEQREQWKEVFRALAEKATLPVETFEEFMAWQAAVCIKERGYYVPHKGNSRSYFARLAAWWQKLGLLPKGNTERFREIATQMMHKRDARDRGKTRYDRFAIPRKDRSWRPLDNLARKHALDAIRTAGFDPNELGVYVRSANWKTFLTVPRTKSGRLKRNEQPEAFIPRSWYRRVHKRGWGVIDGRFIFDWRETSRGKQAAFLMRRDSPRNWFIGVGYLDESGPAVQFCGRPTYFEGDFAFEEDEKN